MQKKTFSLIELIFMIVVMGIIASVALPKLMNTKNSAVVSSLKQDIATVASSVQSYYMQHGKIDKISDTVSLNSTAWKIEDKELKYFENESICVHIMISDNTLDVIINKDTGAVCKALYNDGIATTSYTLE